MVNIDDPHGAELAVHVAPAPLDLWTCAIAGPGAAARRRRMHHDDEGLAFDVGEGERVLPLRSALIGDFNAANLLGVIAALRALGVPLARRGAGRAAAAAGARPHGVVRVAPRASPLVVVDYAHTPDALDQGAADACGRWRGRAAASCGACLAVAATATPPSAR